MDNRCFSAEDVDIQITETVFQGFFRILKYRLRHKLFSGEWSVPLQRELFARGDSVGVLLYDEKRDRVALAQQFRIGCLANKTSAWVWEVVAGMVKLGENAEDVAVREVLEETGLVIVPSQLQAIARYYSSPGGTDERLQLFCARCDLPDSVAGVFGLPEEHEDIRLEVFSTADVFSAVREGNINNAASIIALQWLQLQMR
jgi:ADP-ribose pyrophosphatase